jgi:AcrR family transcriptional regulator
MDAAEILFLEQGFGAVSMDAIAKQGGVSKKTIYCLFDTKEELFAAMMRTHMDERHAPVALPDVDTAAAFESAVAVYLTQLGEAILGPVAVGLFRLSVAESPRFPALAQAFYREGAWRHISTLSAWLKRQADRGVIAVDDPVAMANMLTSFAILEPLRAAALGVRAIPTEDEIAARAKMQAQILTRGVIANG